MKLKKVIICHTFIPRTWHRLLLTLASRLRRSLALVYFGIVILSRFSADSRQLTGCSNARSVEWDLLPILLFGLPPRANRFANTMSETYLHLFNVHVAVVSSSSRRDH